MKKTLFIMVAMLISMVAFTSCGKTAETSVVEVPKVTTEYVSKYDTIFEDMMITKGQYHKVRDSYIHPQYTYSNKRNWGVSNQ